MLHKILYRVYGADEQPPVAGGSSLVDLIHLLQNYQQGGSRGISEVSRNWSSVFRYILE